MKAIDYCKKYGLTSEKLSMLLNKEIFSDYVLTPEETLLYPNSLNTTRKARKVTSSKTKKHKVKAGKAKENPWNKDNLKVRAWILKK